MQMHDWPSFAARVPVEVSRLREGGGILGGVEGGVGVVWVAVRVVLLGGACTRETCM